MADERAVRIRDSCPCGTRQILGGRSTVGHRALDAVIGVRIPASQPTSLASLARWLLGPLLVTPRFASLIASGLESLPPSQPSRVLLTRRLSRRSGVAAKADAQYRNAGPCGYTVAYRPWRLAVSIEFPTEQQALRFERYLNSGSGRAFTKRHFAPLDDG